eukprot:Amastigsp_a849163_12.p3 type:complete len:153 gc:universal Amastigsp_a849163_12:951-1409(+)
MEASQHLPRDPQGGARVSRSGPARAANRRLQLEARGRRGVPRAALGGPRRVLFCPLCRSSDRPARAERALAFAAVARVAASPRSCGQDATERRQPDHLQGRASRPAQRLHHLQRATCRRVPRRPRHRARKQVARAPHRGPCDPERRRTGVCL